MALSPGDDGMNAPFHELSDGLERSPPGEGADIAPDWTDVQEDQ
jgi:hypothetical protein